MVAVGVGVGVGVVGIARMRRKLQQNPLHKETMGFFAKKQTSRVGFWYKIAIEKQWILTFALTCTVQPLSVTVSYERIKIEVTF